MKKYLAARMRISAILMAGALGSFTFIAPHTVDAQSTPEKIRLMAETLRARDSGNLETAKAKAEELIKIAPNDENVQRLLASINNEMDRRNGGAAVYGQAPNVSAEEAMQATSGETAADALAAAAAASQSEKLAAAKNALGEADKLVKLGAYSDANSLLSSAASSLTRSTSTASTLDAIDDAKSNVILSEAKAKADAGDLKGAEELVNTYRAAGGSESKARSLENKLNKEISDPYELDINAISPEYVAQSKIIRDLLTRGRAQYLNGDYDGASATFREVEARDANNPEAKLFQTKIAEILGGVHKQNFYKTRQQMLTEVDQSWERPKVFDVSVEQTGNKTGVSATAQKMNSIVIPQVNFSGMELTRVIETLSELSLEYDDEKVGVNIVPLFDPNEKNPRVNISLRNLSLDRILQFVTQQVNFNYDIGDDAVTVAPSDSIDGSSTTVTEFFPISRATVIRLTGFRDGGGSGSSGPVDPFAPPSSGGGGSGPSASDEVEALQGFFQSAGVNFELAGTSLAFDGEQLIVTQTRRNLERMRIILRNYNEVKQVEIEAKFLEVTQNDLEEVGFDWSVGDSFNQYSDGGFPIADSFGNPTGEYARSGSTGNNRSLNDAFGISSNNSAITINGNVVADNSAPDISTAIDLASSATSLFTATGWSLNGYDVDLAIRALSRKVGSDLMSAPKVTVLSGKRATITVAQELRYPESFGDIEADVGRSGGGSSTSGDSAGSAVAITAGTPQDFVTRNIGVEMSVTPNVENDDTISLILEPRVTEFEGFVEYGGPSVAVTGGITVTVPAGFYQPVFSTREISTEVTVFDGATVVMGGLTRDEVKTVNDKVPVLGDIPGLGRLFRSEGETRQKRNLLIFVTANLVSPGGSPARQNYRNVNANSLFQNPTIMTPAGTANRSIDPAASE
ncbi:MAG: type II secretory pathway, component PulD [Opitutales bacterium]|nr:type II secretory pathway, component PulD [Opitutales bacterium]